MQSMITGLMLLCLASQASSAIPTPKEQYQALLKEYEAADLQWNKDYDVNVRPPAKVDLEAWYRANPLWSFVPRFIKLAETNPDDPAAIDALIWVTDLAMQRVVWVQELFPLYNRAADLLAEHDRIDDPRVGLACLGGLRYAGPGSEKLLRIAVNQSRNREVRGRACMALVKLLEAREVIALSHAYDEGGKPVLPPLIAKKIDPAFVKYIRETKPDALSNEVESLLERATKEYGDVIYDPRAKDARRRTIAEVARSELHELRDLSVGKVAPEIKGESVDGKVLKLSDYRGKVVVLSFWASWCGPCMDLVPHERSLVERLKGKPFALLGIDGDADRQKALKAIAKERMNWPSWWDQRDGDGPIATAWNVRGWPTLYILDHNGVIRYKSFVRADLGKLVDDLLKEMEAAKKP
jgi:thiol-disulfide isomerase/thioredoxin